MALGPHSLLYPDQTERLEWWLPKPKNERVTYDISNTADPNTAGYSIDQRHWFYTYQHSAEQEQFIRNTLHRLDTFLDIDFEEVDVNADITIWRAYDSDHANWSNYRDSNSIGGGVQDWFSYNRPVAIWRDVRENDAFLEYEKHTIVHEIGHALGLDHPDGDGYNSQWTEDESVMSYNDGSNSERTWFRDFDLQALQLIWGTENDTSIGDTTTGTTDVTTTDATTSISIDFGRLISGLSSARDAVSGTVLADLLAGGLGSDLITGGAGPDQFLFNVLDRFGSKGADSITDFNNAEGDQLLLSSSALPGLISNELNLCHDRKALKAAQKSGVQLIYHQATGQLFFDQNGISKGYGKGGLFAVLQGGPELLSSDITLLDVV